MTRVIIVDNNINFRKGLKAVLNSMEHASIIAEVSTENEFLEVLKSERPDVVFLNVRIPLINMINAIKEAKIIYPEIAIFAFSAYENDDYKKSMLNAGVNGYLYKSQDNYEMIHNIIEHHKEINNP